MVAEPNPWSSARGLVLTFLAAVILGIVGLFWVLRDVDPVPTMWFGQDLTIGFGSDPGDDGEAIVTRSADPETGLPMVSVNSEVWLVWFERCGPIRPTHLHLNPIIVDADPSVRSRVRLYATADEIDTSAQSFAYDEDGREVDGEEGGTVARCDTFSMILRPADMIAENLKFLENRTPSRVRLVVRVTDLDHGSLPVLAETEEFLLVDSLTGGEIERTTYKTGVRFDPMTLPAVGTPDSHVTLGWSLAAASALLLFSGVYSLGIRIPQAETRRARMEAERQSQVAGAIHHEVAREALKALRSDEMLADPKLPPELRERASKIRTTALRVLHEVSDETGAMVTLGHSERVGTPRPINVADALLLTGFDELDFDLELDGTEVLGDRFLLRLAWRNLCKNAVRHGQATKITVRQNAGVFVIIDNGSGMNEGALREAWDTGTRANTTGTGKGLSIIRRVIAAHDGAVRMSSPEGSGVRFDVELPTA